MKKDKEDFVEVVGQDNENIPTAKPFMHKAGVFFENARQAAKNAGQIIAKAAVDAGNATKNAVASAGQDAKDKFTEIARDVKESSEQHSLQAAQEKLEKEARELCPIFPQEISAPDFVFPEMLNIVDPDKKHLESKACERSIGYYSVIDDLKVMNLYPAFADKVGLTFLPSPVKSVYYCDPCKSDVFVDMSNYFYHVKKAKVEELKMIAYNLGAKKFSVKFKTVEKSMETKAGKADIKAKGTGGLKAEHMDSSAKKEVVEVAAEMELQGSDTPIMPRLVYFKNEQDIQNLIHMRMDNSNCLTKATYELQYSNSVGIKEKDAAKIDSALKELKFNAAVSVSEQAKTESNMTLEYYIEF